MQFCILIMLITGPFKWGPYNSVSVGNANQLNTKTRKNCQVIEQNRHSIDLRHCLSLQFHQTETIDYLLARNFFLSLSLDFVLWIGTKTVYCAMWSHTQNISFILIVIEEERKNPCETKKDAHNWSIKIYRNFFIYVISSMRIRFGFLRVFVSTCIQFSFYDTTVCLKSIWNDVIFSDLLNYFKQNNRTFLFLLLNEHLVWLRPPPVFKYVKTKIMNSKFLSVRTAQILLLTRQNKPREVVQLYYYWMLWPPIMPGNTQNSNLKIIWTCNKQSRVFVRFQFLVNIGESHEDTFNFGIILLLLLLLWMCLQQQLLT